MATHNEVGKTGESLASKWFSDNNYTVLHTNWRYKYWEIDLIATKNNILHFIEVKTITTLQFGQPEEKISKKKIKNLIDASAEFLFQHPEWQRVQFDVISITMLKNKDVEYFLIEDVYL